VEFDGVRRGSVENALGLEEHAQGLENCDSATAIVVGAWSSQNRRQEQVNRVLMRANDYRLVALAGDGRDDRRLSPGVWECLD
jgi:hypothetical protein